jgi:hypothetical protein
MWSSLLAKVSWPVLAAAELQTQGGNLQDVEPNVQ